jgi:hypothetical protein
MKFLKHKEIAVEGKHAAIFDTALEKYFLQTRDIKRPGT